MSDSWVSKDWMHWPERMSHTLAFLSQPCEKHKQWGSSVLIVVNSKYYDVTPGEHRCFSPQKQTCCPSPRAPGPDTARRPRVRGSSAAAARSPHPTERTSRRRWKSGSVMQTSEVAEKCSDWGLKKMVMGRCYKWIVFVRHHVSREWTAAVNY